MHTPKTGKTVVIGFGSDLRGEDRAGRIVAEQIALWDDPRVEALSVHQLGPEFAQDIAEARTAIFVDAVPADRTVASLREQAGVHSPRLRASKATSDFGHGQARRWARITHPMLIRLHPAQVGEVLGHSPNPSALLFLARALFGRSPRSYLIGIPATRFEFGDEISPATHGAIGEAVEMVRELTLRPLSHPTPSPVRRKTSNASPCGGFLDA
jgi:hydrogenase maturation protease